MDATVDDFLNEINEIAPPKPPKQKGSVWQQCFDKLTGYTYYWNTKTDEVTWNTPPDMKQDKKQKKQKNISSKKELYVPPKLAPLFPKFYENTVKIYSIGENSKKNEPDKPEEKEKAQKRPRTDSESEDEKIELISSYGEDSESESDEPEIIVRKEEDKKCNDSNASDEDDDLDILTTIQKRAKELKELGVLPGEVTHAVTPPPPEEKTPSLLLKDKNKALEKFSLVVGYSDSEEEQENEEMKAIFPSVEEMPKVSHSTLFPITKPIDVKDFMQPAPVQKPLSPHGDFDSKVFQRKRRIGVDLVNTPKKKKEETFESPNDERKGFGFKSQDKSANNIKDNIYAGFKKGGVMFVKSDVLNPTLPKAVDEGRRNEEQSEIIKEDVENMYYTVQEKLEFLTEGRPTVSPVQVMVIQAETLFTAVKDGALKLSYLQRWLEETCSELIKLEKDAAPEGWLLQWDRYEPNRLNDFSHPFTLPTVPTTSFLPFVYNVILSRDHPSDLRTHKGNWRPCG